MRRLMWFTLGFGAVCVLLTSFTVDFPLWIPGTVFCCTAVAVWLLGRKWRWIIIAAMILLGIGCGCMRLHWVLSRDLEPLEGLDGQTLSLIVTAEDYSRQGQYSEMVDGSLWLEGQRYRVQVYLMDEVHLSPGDTLEAEFRLRVTAPESERASTYYQGRGIFLVATQKSDGIITPASGNTLRYFPARLARKIGELLDVCLPEDTAPFARALLLGDTSQLDYATDTALTVSGIRHVAAVSGLHVGILYGLIVFLTGRRKFLTALLGFPALALFAAVAGFTPSVTRACAMIGLMMASQLFSKEYDPPTALSFACLILLLVNPFCILSVSFQLSVASVAGILMAYSRLYGFLTQGLTQLPKKSFRARLLRWTAGNVSVTLSAMVLTTPLCAWYFGCVSLIGIVTNLLTLWAVTIVFCALAAVCTVGAISLSAGMILGKFTALPIRYILWMAKILSRFPLAAVYTESVYIRFWLVLVYALLALFLLIRKRPWIFVLIGAIALGVGISLSWLLPRQDNFRVTVLDVGQGQCILLQSQGKSFLVDCGGDSDVTAADTAAGTLLSQGIFRLDGVILTHGDRDHAGALCNLLTRVDAKCIYLSVAVDAPLREELENITETVFLQNRTEISMGTGTLWLYPAISGVENNENSMCVLYETEKCGILITGDRSEAGEALLVRSWDLPQVDILVAGHHGAKTSTSQLLLDAVQPEIVVISVGKNNVYGHPAPETLSRLEEYGCTVYRTDELGTILFRR